MLSNQIKIKSSYSSSVTQGVVAQSPEPEAHVLNGRAYLIFKTYLSNWNLELLVFEERGKPEYPGKSLSEQSREITSNLAHIWSELRIEPGPYWWEASALTTAPALLPLYDQGFDSRIVRHRWAEFVLVLDLAPRVLFGYSVIFPQQKWTCS